MGHISKASSWGSITKKIIIYTLPLFLVYFVYMFISNQMVYHNHNFPSVQHFCKSRSFRFLFRELEVYTFAYFGYKFIVKHLSDSWSKLFLIVLFLIDIIVSSIGAVRYFIGDSQVLDMYYNQILVFIASPFYFLIFTIFAIYLRPGIDLRSNENQS